MTHDQLSAEAQGQIDNVKDMDMDADAKRKLMDKYLRDRGYDDDDIKRIIDGADF